MRSGGLSRGSRRVRVRAWSRPYAYVEYAAEVGFAQRADPLGDPGDHARLGRDVPEPGDAVALPEKGGSVRANVVVESNQPVTSVELVMNGAVYHLSPYKTVSSEGVVRQEASRELDVKEGSWIAA